MDHRHLCFVLFFFPFFFFKFGFGLQKAGYRIRPCVLSTNHISIIHRHENESPNLYIRRLEYARITFYASLSAG